MTEPESGPIAFFTEDHRRCDSTWGELEEHVTRGDDAAAQKSWKAFHDQLLLHLKMEEEVLFPAFEAATGMTGGPTAVMRHEHVQMRRLLEHMAGAANGGDLQRVLDQGDTLLMLIQQHNAKEEAMLYPMTERALAARWSEIAQKLRSYL